MSRVEIPGLTAYADTVPGLLVPGTISNLYNRPVLKNPDGSYSTTSSFSFEEDGREVLVPSVIDGKRLSQKDAIAHYRKTGEHLGKFDSPKSADAYATDLHNRQAAYGDQLRRLPKGPQPTWDSIDRQLDKHMPTAKRDTIRQHYFDTWIRPRVRPGYSVEATRDLFFKNTAQAVPPIGERIGGVLGNLLVEGAAFTALSALIGPVSAGLARTLIGTGDAATLAANIGRGGLAMATMSAIEAEDGDRVNAGLRGAALGAAWELGIHALSRGSEKLIREAVKQNVAPSPERLLLAERTGAQTISQVPAVYERPGGIVPGRAPEFQAFPGGEPRAPVTVTEVPPTVPRQITGRPLGQKLLTEGYERAFRAQRVFGPVENKAVAEMKVAEAAEAKRKGFLMSPPKVTDTGLTRRGGFVVTGKDAAGNAFTLSPKKGMESEALATMETILHEGGSMDAIQSHSASTPRMTEFLRYFARKAEQEDSGLMLNISPASMENAEKVAKRMNKLGLRGTVVNDATVRVGPESEALKTAKAKEQLQAVTEFIAKGDKAKLDVGQGEHAQKGFRIGHIRAILQSAEDRKGLGPLYKELHNLQGDLGEHYGPRNRADIGIVSQQFFEDSVAGRAPDFKDVVMNSLPGERQPGVRPPPGNKEPTPGFKGYRRAIPTNEKTIWDPVEQQIYTMEGKVRRRPTGLTKIIETPSEEFGATGAQIRSPEGPMRVLTKDATKRTGYHENLHDGNAHAGIDHGTLPISATARKTGMDIFRGLLRDYADAYKDMPAGHKMEEAWAHLSEGFRFNDRAALEQFARDDTSIDHLKQFVRETSEAAWDAISDDTVPIRAYERRLIDLMRRTSPNPSQALDDAAVHGYQSWFDPDLGKWVMRDGDGRELWKNELNDVWDEIHNGDPRVLMPDQMHTAYFRGIKRPVGTSPNGPVDLPGTPEMPHMGFGSLAFTQLVRPAQATFSTLQKLLDRAKAGIQIYNPHMELVRASQRAARIGDQLGVELDKIGLPREKWIAYGEVASRPEATWVSHAKALQLDAEDLVKIRALADVDAKHVAEGRIGIFDTLSKMRQAREVSGNLDRLNFSGPVKDALKNSDLGETLDLGQVTHWVKRANYERAIQPELEAFNKEAAKFTGNPEMQEMFRNFTNYLRGIPDNSQKIMNSFMEGMESSTNRIINSMNRSLPKEMQIPQAHLDQQSWRTIQATMYMAGLGGRPAVAIRDTFQAQQAIFAIGPTAFAQGMAEAMTAEGRAFAEEAGATLHKRSTSAFFQGVSSDLPAGGRFQRSVNKLSDAMLSPSRWGHNVGRHGAFLGEYKQALKAVGKYRLDGDATALRDSTSIWFHDTPEQSRLIAKATPQSGLSAEDVAKEIALSAVEATQYGGVPGTILRTGLGRIMGQYGSWPMNHLEFGRKLVMRAIDNPKKGIPALGGWLATNYAAFEVGKNLGIDVTKWLFFSPAGFAGSPGIELAQHLLEAPEETDKGREARKAILEFPLTQFVPTGVAIQTIGKAIKAGDTSPATWLGFKRYKEPTQELTDWEWIRKELGFKPRPEE
ncbi:MAG: hypothetical protein C5B60_00485 [Chloroflexi bacterium]|nr:MAG: hypothetical protein C5B60_00485 [Chloroflexota bacterium]